MAAAVEAAHAGPGKFVLTARAENYVHGRFDLADTIARLQSFERRAPTCCSRPACASWTRSASW